MINIRKIDFYMIFFSLFVSNVQNIASMSFSQEDTHQIKKLLHSVSSSVSNSISNAITQQKSRSYLVSQLEEDLQSQNLSDEQIKTIMDSVDEIITDDYYNQILENYNNAISLGKTAGAISVINQVEMVTEKSVDSLIGNEIDKISDLKKLKLTKKQKRKIKKSLMEEESDISKDKILENFKKDKKFNAVFSSNIQSISEHIHIHAHAHTESHTDSSTKLSRLGFVKIPGQSILDEPEQLPTESVDTSESLLTNSTNPEADLPLLSIEPTQVRTIPTMDI